MNKASKKVDFARDALLSIPILNKKIRTFKEPRISDTKNNPIQLRLSSNLKVNQSLYEFSSTIRSQNNDYQSNRSCLESEGENVRR